MFHASGRSACHQRFKEYLEKNGFLVYPVEFDLGNCNHPLVDIAARMGSFYWAFEYKSWNDSIARGVEQVRCYSDWFDYVVLVSEKRICHTDSIHYWNLRSLGAGIWNYYPLLDKCITTKNPKIQGPDPNNRKTVAKRFSLLQKSRARSSSFDLFDKLA